VDLLFSGTTSTCFELEDADEEVTRNWRGEQASGDDADPGKAAGFRTHGKSEDSRDDLPQIVIGLAVTRDGIPVWVWCWPGSTSDSALIRQVKADMRDWVPGKIIWVADRGFSSAENRRCCNAAPGATSSGRSSAPDPRTSRRRCPGKAATSRSPGTCRSGSPDQRHHRPVRDLPQPRRGDPGRRHQRPARRQAGRTDRQHRRAERNQAGGAAREDLHDARPERFLRVTPGGLLRTGKAKIKAEANLDGKYLLRCADPQLSAEDIALGYKQLLEVERGWRDMKQVLDLRPVYHRLEERIRSHVLLCWLALVLIRIAENHTGQTWPVMCRELDRIYLGTFTGPAGTFRQRTELSKPARDQLAKLSIDPPPKIHELTPGT
jgi:hypothetical protein